MRTFSFFTLFLLLFATSMQAQPGTDTTLVITFEKTVHDYGTIVKGGDGTCEFRFTNPGLTPLVLSSVTASCGCTVAEWTKEPILPGTDGVIKVKYNTSIVGNFSKTVTVNSNARNARVTLVIKGKVVQPETQQ